VPYTIIDKIISVEDITDFQEYLSSVNIKEEQTEY
jgi:hypothetical protein